MLENLIQVNADEQHRMETFHREEDYREMKNFFMPDYRRYADEVVEWNKIAGLRITPDFQWKLVKEEFDELCEAYHNKDKENFLKELCDMFVVLSYHVYLSSYKIYLNKDMFVVTNSLGTSSIESALSTLSDMLMIGDNYSAIKIVINVLNRIDANDKRALAEVIASNSSKFEYYIQDNESVYDATARHIEEDSNGRYEGVTWRLSSNRVIYFDNKGKILKCPITYREASVSRYVY